MSGKVHGLIVLQHLAPGVTQTQTFHFTTSVVREQFVTYLTQTEHDLEVKGGFDVPVCENVDQAVDRLHETFGFQINH